MRKILLIVICFTILHSIFTSCSLCQLEPPPYGYPIDIDLIDRNTGRSLISLRDSGYTADSAFLEMNNRLQRYKFNVRSKDTILQSDYIYPGNNISDTLYFKYHNTKPDTIIVFSHDEKRKKCGERFSIVEIDRIILNGIVVCEYCTGFSDLIRIRK